jgi:molecular chaperone GrpE
MIKDMSVEVDLFKEIITSEVNNEQLLLKIAKNTKDPNIRYLSIDKINNINGLKEEDADELENMLKKETNDTIHELVKNKYAWYYAYKVNTNEGRENVISYIDDEAILADIVKNSENSYIRELSIDKLIAGETINETILADIVKNIEDIDIVKKSISKINNEDILMDIMKDNNNINIIKQVFSKINNTEKGEEVLKYKILNSKDKEISTASLNSLLNLKEEENDKKIKRYQKDKKTSEKHKEEEINEIIESANKGLILKIIGSYENFDRTLDNVNAAEKSLEEFKLSLDNPDANRESLKKEVENIHSKLKSLKQGVELTHSQLENTLEKEGLKEIPTEGEKIDANKHIVTSTENNPDYEDGIIIKEISKGYEFKGKVIQSSKVIVNKRNDKENE